MFCNDIMDSPEGAVGSSPAIVLSSLVPGSDFIQHDENNRLTVPFFFTIGFMDEVFPKQYLT
jgi:hypothetical protein